MPSDLTRRLQAHRTAVRFAGWLVLAVCAVLYVWARSAATPAADVVRVGAFLVPVALAALGSAASWRESPPASIQRVFWGWLALATACLFASEAYYGAYQLTVDMGGPPMPSAFEVLNLAAAVFFFALIGSMTPLRDAATVPRIRMITGAVAVAATWYVALFRWVTSPMASASGHSAPEAAVWALYVFVGSALLLGSTAALFRRAPARWSAWQVLTFLSLSGYSTFVLLWPAWYLGESTPSDTLSDVLLTLGYMVGYHLFFMASLYWITDGAQRWSRPSRALSHGVTARGSLAVTTLALVSVPLMALALYGTEAGSFDRTLYFGALALTTIAVVLRTSFSDVESVGLRVSSSEDSATGVLNRRAFDERLREMMAEGEAYGNALSIAVVDIDDFARFNVVLGREAGDAALRAVAEALRQSAGDTQVVVARLGGDEFAVIFQEQTGARGRSDAGRSDAGSIVRAAQSAIADGGEALSLSAGVASWPQDGVSPAELLAAADAALYWAKYQGKHRIAAYDEQVVRAVDAEERLHVLAQRSRLDIVRALAAATDARDSATAYHSRQVAALAAMVAEAAGLAPERVQDVQMAALLHDVGKVAVPDSVLRKRARLSPAERAVLREHAELGARILGGTELSYMAPWIRAHHEHWDGTGYPDGLAGEAIPLEARIIGACDLYDEMVSGNPERGPLSRSAALQELDQSIGRALDPAYAEVLIDVVGRSQSLGWSEAWLS